MFKIILVPSKSRAQFGFANKVKRPTTPNQTLQALFAAFFRMKAFFSFVKFTRVKEIGLLTRQMEMDVRVISGHRKKEVFLKPSIGLPL